MGLASEHVLGRDMVLFGSIEGTAGTFDKAVATDAIELLSMTMVPNIKRNDRMDARPSRDLLERMTGKSEHAWSYNGYLIPSGTVDTPPGVAAFLTALMGTQTINGSTSVVWTQASTQALSTMSLTRQHQENYQESMWGAWVESGTFTVAGGEEPKCTFEGGAMGYVATGRSTLNGAMAGSTTMIVQTADKDSFGINSMIKIGTTDDVRVTVESAAPSFTVDTSTTEDDASAVVPAVPSSTFAGSGGNPISGVLGTFTWDSFAAKITNFEVTYKNNIKPLNDEAIVQDVSDVIPGIRTITGKMTARLRRDHVVHLLSRKAFATVAVSMTVGNVAGDRFVFSLPQVELEFSEVSIPEAEEAVVDFPFTALASGSYNDAMSITHN